MRASVLDLRYKMKDVLSALDRNEIVEILYHGKLKGILSPFRQESQFKVVDHPFFGMHVKADVNQTMTQLRGGRYNDL